MAGKAVLHHAGPGSACSGEGVALPRKIVRCAQCHKFVTEIVITAPKSMLGPLVTLKNLKCPACGYVANVDVGIGEKDEPSFTAAVEQQLRKMNTGAVREEQR